METPEISASQGRSMSTARKIESPAGLVRSTARVQSFLTEKLVAVHETAEKVALSVSREFPDSSFLLDLDVDPESGERSLILFVGTREPAPPFQVIDRYLDKVMDEFRREFRREGVTIIALPGNT